jgi:thiol-disulfide isomerase/thioredoxin
MPVHVWVIDKKEIEKLGERRVDVLYTAFPFVQGELSLPSRTVMMRFAYDVRSGSIALSQARESMDIDGDGQIDGSPSSSESAIPEKGDPPLFHVGGIFVRATSVDLASLTFVAKSYPRPTDYKRVELFRGANIPNFPITDLAGKQRTLSDVRAKYTLLDFWATWCTPCVRSLPVEAAAYAKFHDKGFEILGVLGDDDKNLAKTLLAATKATWPVGQYNRKLIEDYFQIQGWPTLVLIDDQNRIVSLGGDGQMGLEGDELEKTLAKLLP